MEIYQSETTTNPIFQTTHKNSKRYQQIESTDLVDYFQGKGWIHDTTSFAQPRDKTKLGFQKHVMIFEHPDLIIDDENRLQLLITNSHDGTSSIIFNIGIYRAVCANGMVVGTQFFEERLRHVGHNFYLELENIKDKIVARAPYILQTIKNMQATELTRMEVVVLAEEIAKKRFASLGDSLKQVNLRKLITPQRIADTSRDLYTVFNILQERVIRGGIEYVKEVHTKDLEGNIKVEMKNNTTREIKSIDGKRKLNQMVFDTVVAFKKVA